MKSNLGNILKKEMRELFRDRKSLAMMLIIPVFIPLIIIGMSALFESQINKGVEEYNRIGFGYELSQVERELASQMEIEAVQGSPEQLASDYENGEIDLYITKEGNTYTINSDGSDTASYATGLAERYLEVYRQHLQQEYLAAEGVDPEAVFDILTVEENVIEGDNYFAGYIKNYAFLFIIMAITVSATYPATDTTAGERERGTLETLLTFPVKSRDIIVGKFMGVTVSAAVTGLVSLVLAIIFLIIAKSMFSIYEGVDIMFSPVSIILAIFVILAYSMFISGLCIAVAGRSKTFKEAQSALTPLIFISFFPGMIAFMMGVTGSPLLSIVPFLNFVVVFTDVNNGSVELLDILLMLVSTVAYIAAVLTYVIKQYKSEKVLFAKREVDHGEHKLVSRSYEKDEGTDKGKPQACRRGH